MTDSTRNDTQKDISKLSPDKLVRRFSHSGIVLCIFVAFALHVVVLGATSVGYIHGLVDPAWKAQQDALKQQAAKAKAAKAAQAAKKAAAKTASATTRPAGKRQTSAAKKTASPETAPGQHKLPPELTAKAKPGEIPASPSAGLGIDETEKGH